MFDRVSYKINAKKGLIGRKTWPVLMSMMLYILFGIACSGMDLALVNHHIVSTVILGILVYGFFGSVNVAQSRVYLKLAKTEEKAHLSDFIAGLDSGWAKGFLEFYWIYLWMYIWLLVFAVLPFALAITIYLLAGVSNMIFVCGLLLPAAIIVYCLFIPKLLSYSQAYRILAENPGVSVRNALTLSIKITKGHKWNLFVMWLSFIGWWFLAILTFGILLFWLTPYIELSFTNAYLAMKKQALSDGRITLADLNATSAQENME